MKNSTSESPLNEKKSFDWTIVLKIILKILTIGLYHVEKNQKKDAK